VSAQEEVPLSLDTASEAIERASSGDARIRALDGYKLVLMRAGIRDPQPRCSGN